MKKLKFLSRPWAKVRHQGPPGAARPLEKKIEKMLSKFIRELFKKRECAYTSGYSFSRGFLLTDVFLGKFILRVRLDMWKYDVDNKEVKRWDEGIERAIKKKKKKLEGNLKG